MCGFIVVPKMFEEKQVAQGLTSIEHRGPDSRQVKSGKAHHFGFVRLAIMGLGPSGDQPFINGKDILVCNGEVYNYKQLKKQYRDFSYASESDCEVLLPLFKKSSSMIEAADLLDAEFAFCYWDEKQQDLKAGRDAMGIRPLFYAYSKEGEVCFASEVKALMSLGLEAKAFPPGHIYEFGEFKSFCDLGHVETFQIDDLEGMSKKIRELLTAGVLKRLQADTPVGFLLSGGLDSSLVCAIAAKHLNRPIKTFSIGMEKDAIDLKYAKQVADFLGTEHHEVIISEEDVLAELPEVIQHLETWDITTVRASIGMYHVCKYIKEKTDVKVVLTGEVADELFGYKYTDFAPDEWEFQKEAQKRIREIYLYDVLRADRSIAAHSLEARVPFSDKDFVRYVMSLHPKLKMNTSGHGKYLLRKAFEDGQYLPEEILWRQKAAFSDAVGHSLSDCLKAFSEVSYTAEEFDLKKKSYSHGTPFTKESLLYREIFEKFFKGQGQLIPDYWMPNKSWKNCDVDDPSARVLPNYGASGV